MSGAGSVRRFGRRLITIPVYVTLLAVALSVLPLTLLLAASVDVARHSPWAVTRSVLFFTWYLLCEAGGIVASFALWLLGRIVRVARNERYLRWHFRLQCLWARALLGGAATIFGMRFEVEGDEDIGAGPVLLFMRHASVGDTVFPAVFLSDRHGLRLRYVMKRELLWDPCLDIVGNRIPNYFVHRGGADGAREIAGITRLADGMKPGEGVLLFPEGTRFTKQKRLRILERLAKSGDPILEAKARSLLHTLPPRLGGALALLERRPDADVLFCAHVGFDNVTSFSKFLHGGLVRATIKVIFWRIPAADVPSGREARTSWLFDQWRRVDEWIAAQKGEGSVPHAGFMHTQEREEQRSAVAL